MSVAAAALLADRITSTLAEKALEWGQAINRAERAKGTKDHEFYCGIARAHGLELAQLSAGIAKRLRPEGP
jgi:hypothetical protein